MNDYENWLGKSHYTEQQATQLIQERPFQYNPFNRSCEVVCKGGYWSSPGSIHYPGEDVFDYRCIYDNCKNWNQDDTS